FDVVASARRAFATRRVGHAGTLDPLATGLLVLATDTSTRLVPYLTGHDKQYLALISLGAGTPTLDGEGPVTATAPVPGDALDRAPQALAELTGEQDQLPPRFSAVHVNGQRAYQAARAGQEVKLEPRRVTVQRLDLLAVLDRAQDASRLAERPDVAALLPEAGQPFAARWPQPLGDYPTLAVLADVSAGTYIRSLARDLGERLGVPAHLAGLIRTRVGGLNLRDAAPLDALAAAKPWPEAEAAGLPLLAVDEPVAKDLRDGKRLPSDRRGLVAATCNQQLVAILEGDGVALRVKRAWPPA
ncbi:MAG TPA: tRNA pseudouridine(55) synthase TruB, partial [Deinococcales bacterium]|nr:tRNA pseudouridine(55) synthase TruB [Deinococcales bacterium]